MVLAARELLMQLLDFQPSAIPWNRDRKDTLPFPTKKPPAPENKTEPAVIDFNHRSALSFCLRDYSRGNPLPVHLRRPGTARGSPEFCPHAVSCPFERLIVLLLRQAHVTGLFPHASSTYEVKAIIN